jgi:hypothetical protein
MDNQQTHHTRRLWAILGGLVAFLTLLVAGAQLLNDRYSADQADIASVTAIALQKHQVQILSEIATTEAQNPKTGPTATAIAGRIDQLEGTLTALQGNNIQPTLSSTQAAIATPTPAPALTLAPTHTPVPTSTPVKLIEDFESPALDQSWWEYAGPPVELADGSIRLRSNVSVFPYVYTKQNPFPTRGNFVLTVVFRYLKITQRGVGFVVDKTVPPFEAAAHGMEGALFAFWQGESMPLTVRFRGNSIYVATGKDSLQHTLELRYDGKYSIAMDGDLIFTSPAVEDRPSALWFGNPVNVGNTGEWTSLQIDSIHLTSVP